MNTTTSSSRKNVKFAWEWRDIDQRYRRRRPIFFGELTYYYYPPKCRYWSVLCVQWQKKIMICQDHALINCDFAPTCPSCTKCNKIGEKVQNTKLNDARRDRTLLLVLVLTGDSNRFLLKIVISDQILYLSFDSRKSHA